MNEILTGRNARLLNHGLAKNTDYYEAIPEPGRLLRDESSVAERSLHAPGAAMLWTGSFADVYKLHCPATGNTGPSSALRARCGIFKGATAASRSAEQARLPFTVDFQYLERASASPGRGSPSSRSLGRRADAQSVRRRAPPAAAEPEDAPGAVVKLAERLHEVGVAHADLQHGNVLLVPMARGALALRLIDYDGMYVPALAGTRSGELGHPAYQHPQRLREGTYNAEVDRFSHL